MDYLWGSCRWLACTNHSVHKQQREHHECKRREDRRYSSVQKAIEHLLAILT